MTRNAMATAQERKALNENTFRRANEQMEQKAAVLLGEEQLSRVPFVCECPRQSCTDVVLVTLSEYERVRAGPRRGLAVPGHEDLEIERVVERHDGFLVTEKLGRAGEIYGDEDPRS